MPGPAFCSSKNPKDKLDRAQRTVRKMMTTEIRKCHITKYGISLTCLAKLR